MSEEELRELESIYQDLHPLLSRIEHLAAKISVGRDMPARAAMLSMGATHFILRVAVEEARASVGKSHLGPRGHRP